MCQPIGGQHLTLSYNLDTQTDFIPPGLDIEYRWAFTLSDGTQYRSDPKTLFYMDEQQKWQKKTSGLVTAWWYQGDDAFGQDAVDTATRPLIPCKRISASQAIGPIRILIYANARDLRVALPPNSAEWIGGRALPEYGIIHSQSAPVAPLRRKSAGRSRTKSAT